ncbi:PDZ domain-containing protein [Paenibacillus phyllosphaerae]|uniref:PDZ domain-containing protein n=1 Tax=Paenibacillus phyllosphaerae TaxID=274593 RepID=A0A7W5AWU0_9BACL|nr:PDZ domain-containing protein [Paenibacillus phyllosphaerae]
MKAARILYVIGYGLFGIIAILGEIIWIADPIRIGDYFWIDQMEWLVKLLAAIPFLWMIGAWKLRPERGSKQLVRRIVNWLVQLSSLAAALMILVNAYQLVLIGVALGAAWLFTLLDLTLSERDAGVSWRLRLLRRVVVITATAGILFWPTAYQVTTPGFTFNMNRYAQVEGGAEKGNIEGVLVIDRPAFPIDWVYARMFPHIAISKRDTTQSIGEQLQAAHSQRVGANEVGSAVAFQRVGIGQGIIPTGVYVLAIMKDSPVVDLLKPGDQITAVGGKAVATAAELSEVMSDVAPGKTLNLAIKRDGEELKIAAMTKPSADDAERAVFGIQIEDRVHADLPREVDYRSYLVYQGGPSHGAILALTLIDQLTPGGVTYGNQVAGTGTIGADGTVGLIGGIEQKAYVVWRSGADVFFVPDEQAEEARKGAPALNIVPVRTLDDMLNWLRTHPVSD